MPQPITPAPVTGDPAAHEAQHVHAVYEQIAAHFSATRYKPWPLVAAFVAAQPAGAVGLDMGTGNGKHLALRAGAVRTVGLDRSAALLAHARAAGHDVVRGDALAARAWRAGAFDYALSVATVHHFATAARRQRALEALLRAVRARGGRVLVSVWAAEQGAGGRAVPDVEEGDAGDAGAGRDVFVPWAAPGGGAVAQRYYHLFAAGELRALVCGAAAALGLAVGAPAAGAGVEIVHEGWERANWYVELRRWAA